MALSPYFVPTRHAVRARCTRGARALQVIPLRSWEYTIRPARAAESRPSSESLSLARGLTAAWPGGCGGQIRRGRGIEWAVRGGGSGGAAGAV